MAKKKVEPAAPIANLSSLTDTPPDELSMEELQQLAAAGHKPTPKALVRAAKTEAELLAAVAAAAENDYTLDSPDLDMAEENALPADMVPQPPKAPRLKRVPSLVEQAAVAEALEMLGKELSPRPRNVERERTQDLATAMAVQEDNRFTNPEDYALDEEAMSGSIQMSLAERLHRAVASVVVPEEIEADLAIEEFALDQELLHQPVLYARYALTHAQAEADYKEAAEQLPLVRAHLDELVRERFNQLGEKTTDAKVEAAVLREDAYIDAVGAKIDANRQLQICQVLRDAFAQRAQMLTMRVSYWNTESRMTS